MKKIAAIIVLVVMVMGGFFALSKPAHSPEVSQQPAAMLTFATVQKEVSAGSATLLDVRTAEEYQAGHFVQATNLSLQDIEAGSLPSSAKTQPIYVYCRSGNRSAQATMVLKKAGYEVVTDLGGLDEVKAMGGSLITQ